MIMSAPHDIPGIEASLRMAEAIDRHLHAGARGFIAIRIADGSSDGQVYPDAEAAKAAQPEPQQCTYTHLPPWPRDLWTTAECAEHLEFEAHRTAGCMIHGILTCPRG